MNRHEAREVRQSSVLIDAHSPFPDVRQEIAEGLLYTHSRLNATTKKTLEVASFLYTLVELLSEKVLIGIEELDERKRIVGERLIEQLLKTGNGIVF